MHGGRTLLVLAMLLVSTSGAAVAVNNAPPTFAPTCVRRASAPSLDAPTSVCVPPPDLSWQLRVGVTAWPQEGRVAFTCEGWGPMTVACPPLSDGVHVQSAIARPLPEPSFWSWLARLLPVGEASAAAPPAIPQKITLEVTIHAEANASASWIDVCGWTDQDASTCARRPDASLPSDLGPSVVLALAATIAQQIPKAPTAEFPSEDDITRALDAIVATLGDAPAPAAPAADAPSPPPPPRAPDPGPVDVHGITTVLAPSSSGGPPSASSEWNGSGPSGAWSLSLASATLPPVPTSTPEPRAPPAPPPVEAAASSPTDPPTLRAPDRGSSSAPADDATSPPHRPAVSPRAPLVPQTERKAPPPGPVPTAVVVAGTLAAVLGIVATLFARLRDQRLGDQATRRRILDALRDRTNQTALDLAAALAMHPNTIRYHLWVMTKASYVSSRRAGGRVHYFLPGGASGAAPTALHARPVRALYETVVAHPGVRIRDVCALTKSGKTTVHYRVRLLQDAGLVATRRDGRSIRLFADGRGERRPGVEARDRA